MSKINYSRDHNMLDISVSRERESIRKFLNMPLLKLPFIAASCKTNPNNLPKDLVQ